MMPSENEQPNDEFNPNSDEHAIHSLALARIERLSNQGIDRGFAVDSTAELLLRIALKIKSDYQPNDEGEST